jgi:hypothetical protein
VIELKTGMAMMRLKGIKGLQLQQVGHVNSGMMMMV